MTFIGQKSCKLTRSLYIGQGLGFRVLVVGFSSIISDINMVQLYRLKAYSHFASKPQKPYSHFALHNQQFLLVRHLTTTTSSAPKISPENQHDSSFTVNYLIKSCGLSPEGASKRVSLKSSKKTDRVLGLLRNQGLSETQLSKVVRSCSQVLVLDPDKALLPKIEYFRSIGISRESLQKLWLQIHGFWE